MSVPVATGAAARLGLFLKRGEARVRGVFANDTGLSQAPYDVYVRPLAGVAGSVSPTLRDRDGANLHVG